MKDRREQELMRVKGFEVDREGDYDGPASGMRVTSLVAKDRPWRAHYPHGGVKRRDFANPIAAATWLQQVWLQRRIEKELAVAVAKRQVANDQMSTKGKRRP